MTTVHLVRHAKAKDRASWAERDDLRPLTKRGRREAAAIAARLGDEELQRLVASPFLRCVQTFDPLAVALDLPLETTDLLAEGAAGERAVELLVSLAAAGPVAACTHGDVVFDVLDVVASSGIRLEGPNAAPVASTWALSVKDGRVVGARFDRPAR